MKISAVIDCLYPKATMPEKLRYCSNANINNIELWNYRVCNVGQLSQELEARQMHCEAICTTYFETTKQDLSKFLIELRETCIAAKMLNCNKIITQSGKSRNNPATDALTMIKTLKEAKTMLQEYDITLLIEPLSEKHHPQTFLRSSAATVEILDEVHSDNIKMLFDIYHQHLTEGHVIDNLRRFCSYIGHIHCAGTNNRNELDLGDLNYDYVFYTLSKFYDGCVGFEYIPTCRHSLTRMMSHYSKYF